MIILIFQIIVKRKPLTQDTKLYNMQKKNSNLVPRKVKTKILNILKLYIGVCIINFMFKNCYHIRNLQRKCL